jgi:hippurate hydrolase
MPPIDRIAEFSHELIELRHDLHAHPELGFEEKRTSEIVAAKLSSWGVEVHRGIGKTGVVGVLRNGTVGSRRIGLRADMDALPLDEETNLEFRSKTPGRFHGCGHDGHTTMLLGAARYLAQTKNFDGTVILIFQPAEEGLGGARAMIADGLFDRFPCDEIYALHNSPVGPFGSISVLPGVACAGADFFDIHIKGRGAHAAAPSKAVDPIMIAMTLSQMIQTIVSRNTDPQKAAVVSITKVHAGEAYNVIPETAHLAGTSRTFDAETRQLIRTRLREIGSGVASTFAATVAVEVRDIFSVLENGKEQSLAVADIARELLGSQQVFTTTPKMGSDDFAEMLKIVSGAYFWLGQSPGPGLHNPQYTFDDGILAIGASMLARIAEHRTSASTK